MRGAACSTVRPPLRTNSSHLWEEEGLLSIRLLGSPYRLGEVAKNNRSTNMYSLYSVFCILYKQQRVDGEVRKSVGQVAVK